MSSPDHANRLDKELCRTEEFFRSSFEADCPTWAEVLFVEDLHKHYKDGIYRMPRSALLTRDQYQPSFDQVLDVCTWINFNAVGIFGDSLIINLEYPAERKEHGKRHMVSINLSGPSLKPLRDKSAGDEPRIKGTVRNVAGLGEMELEWCLNDKIVVL
ncbi:MAG: hypothetical protein K2X27_07355 [Candidatus Obscuribacterales bacterium]|nr:hypothetical protein [Candidatus Obscuribacterales bacterium]